MGYWARKPIQLKIAAADTCLIKAMEHIFSWFSLLLSEERIYIVMFW